MESNLKNVQSFKWINRLKNITKSNKDKETIEMDENKLQLSQPSKSHSIVSLLKKLCLGKEKSKTPTSIKILNDPSDAIDSCWIDWGNIKSDSLNINTNYLKTTACENKSKIIDKNNLENSKTDIRFETKSNIKVEGENLDVKSMCNNNSDVDEPSGKAGLDHFDTEKVCKSKCDSDDNQNSSDDEVVERGPNKVYHNKGAHRLNPMQKKDDPGNKEFHDHDGKTSTMKQLMTSSSLTDNIPELFEDFLSKDNCWNYADPLKQYVKNNAAQAGFLCTQDTENTNTGIISEAEVNNMLDRLAEYYRQQDSGQRFLRKLSIVDSKVSKTTEKNIEIQNIKNMLELESLSFVQKRNALMRDIDLERQKLFQEIDEQIQIQNIKKMLELESLSHSLKNKVFLKENNREAAKDHSKGSQDAFKSLSLNHTPVPIQNWYGNVFVKSNNKLPELNVGTPESNYNFLHRNYTSPECNNSSLGSSYNSPHCNYNSSGSNHSSLQYDYRSPEYNYSSSPEQNFNFPDCNNSSPRRNNNSPAYNISSSPECNNSYPQPNFNVLECSNSSPLLNYNFPECNYSSSPECNNCTRESSCTSPGSQLSDLIAELHETVEEFMAEMQNYYFKFNNLAHKSDQPEQGKIFSPLKNDCFKGITPKDQKTSCYKIARNMRVNSAVFSKQKCLDECVKIYEEIRDGQLGTEDREVIHYLKPIGKNKYIRTNLHAAVMEGNLEKVVGIVEIHKRRYKNISYSINLRDRNDGRKRTALDRAEENENSAANDLLIEYLKENYAKNSI